MNSLTEMPGTKQTLKYLFDKQFLKNSSVPDEMLRSKTCIVVTYRLSEPIVLLKT